MKFKDHLFKKRLKEVDKTSLLSLDVFMDGVETKMGEYPYKFQSLNTRRYNKYKLYLKRSIDREYLRGADEKKTEGKCIEVSHDGLLYPESHILVSHGRFKFWVHDLSVADFACFKDEEIQIMMECLRMGKWAIEKFEEIKND